MAHELKTQVLIKCLDLEPGNCEVDFSVFPGSSETAVFEIMKEYVKGCDHIRRNNENQISFFDFMKLRFVSFEEFLEVFKTPLQFDLLEYEDENGQHYREKPNYYYMDYLNPYFLNIKKILNELDYSKFKKDYTPDFQGYIKLLQESPAHGLKSFFFQNPTSFKIPHRDRERHAYITGAAGSGKSELLKALIVQDLFEIADGARKNIILIDPHGDLAEAFYRIDLKEETKDRFIYFDPFLSPEDKETREIIPPNKTPCLNIFQLAPEDRKKEYIDFMAGEIASVFSDLLSNSALSIQMEAVLVPCISTLLWKGNADFTDLQNFMNDDINAELVELGKKSPNRSHAKFFTDKFYDTTYNTTKASLYTKLQTFLNSSNFTKIVTGKSTIDLKKVLNEEQGRFIIFNLSKGRLGADNSKLFGRLILALINTIAFNRAIMGINKRISCFLYVDEFQNYIGKSIIEGLTELRKYGLHFNLACQIVGQEMTEKEKHIVLANTNVKFIGKNAIKSLKTLSLETGLELEEMQELKTGEFFMKVGASPGVKIKVPKTLLQDYWYQKQPAADYNFGREQIKKYYKDIEEHTAPASISNLDKKQSGTKNFELNPKRKNNIEEIKAKIENLNLNLFDDF